MAICLEQNPYLSGQINRTAQKLHKYVTSPLNPWYLRTDTATFVPFVRSKAPRPSLRQQYKETGCHEDLIDTIFLLASHASTKTTSCSQLSVGGCEQLQYKTDTCLFAAVKLLLGSTLILCRCSPGVKRRRGGESRLIFSALMTKVIQFLSN